MPSGRIAQVFPGEDCSQTELCRRLNKTQPTVRKLLLRHDIPKNERGLYSYANVVKLLNERMDFARAKQPFMPMPPTTPTIPTIQQDQQQQELAEGDTVVRRVLRSEGHVTRADITFNDVRLADGIVKVLRQYQEYEVAKGNLVSKEKTAKHFVSIFSNIRKELQAVPAKYGAIFAAELGVDVAIADAALTNLVATILNDIANPSAIAAPA